MKSILIGYGYWGKILEKYINNTSFFELEGIYTPSLTNESLEEYLEHTAAECAFVCTPLATHYEIVKVLLEKNLHVFAEKPLCKSREQTLDLLNLAKTQDVVLYTDYIYTNSLSLNEMKKHLHDYGEIKYIEMKIKQFGRFYNNESVHEIIGVHMLSALLFLFDFSADDITIVSRNDVCYVESIDSSTVFMKTNDISISIECSLRSPVKEREIVVYCEKGILVFNMMTKDTLQIFKINDASSNLSLYLNFSFDENNNLTNALNQFYNVVQERNIDNMELSLEVATLLEKIKSK